MLLDDVKELPVEKWGSHLKRDTARFMKLRAPQARCYVFDREASFKLGRFIRDCPDLIADQIEFAVEPYPTTYVEVEIDAVIMGAGGDEPDNPNADWKLGFLTHHGVTNTLVCNRTVPGVLAGVYGFMNMSILPDRSLVKLADSNDALLQSVELHLLGSTYNKLTAVQRKAFSDRYGVATYGDPRIEALSAQHVFDGHQGEARVYIAALLLLHQKKGISLSEKAAHRAMYRGKSRPFMAHNVVTITLDGPVEIRRALTSGSGETRRAHEVPAHYAHRYGTRNCEHVWVKRENEENHWDCSKCGRFRYLRRDHIRGDASKGFVKKSYNVVTEKSK